MSLAEVLVAMTVFVVAAALALILYNALNQSYKRGDNAADVQQNVRLAFEKMVTDGRMAGFNVNPDGSEDRPDEQIEGAWDTAITIRGDYDFDDPTDSTTPESTLIGGSEISVSTGNDEIVTYVLAKPDGTSSDSLSFNADVQGVPRDGTVETVTVSNIALTHDDPPYTLYRVTVNANSTAVTRTPVADNIYELRFRYYDSGGVLLSPDTPLDPSDDMGGDEGSTDVTNRETIRRVELSITGMTQDPDMKYTDPDDPYDPSKKHRKFVLTQDITPRNLGFEGRPDIDIIPPNQPTNVTACAGQCQGVLVSWDAPPASDLVQQWTVVSGVSTSALGNPRVSNMTSTYVKGLTEGADYYFRVRAEDLSGNVSPMSALAGPVTVGDTTTPSAPSIFQVSGGSGPNPEENDHINVRWTPVTTNVESVMCDPDPNKIRDLKGYNVYRSEATGAFSGGHLYKDADQVHGGITDFDDTNVVACRPYYYNLIAVDRCGNESAEQTEVDGTATTEEVPVKGTGVQATPGATEGIVDVKWDRITENTGGAPVLVDTYQLYRAEGPPGLTPSEALSTIDWSTAYPLYPPKVSDVNAPSFTDTSAYAADPSNSFYYRVAGLTDCASPYDEGAMSDPSEANTCSLGATPIMAPDNGAAIAGNASVGLGVRDSDPADSYTGFLTITDSNGGIVATHGSGANPQSLPAIFI
jgi:hypothetical protein